MKTTKRILWTGCLMVSWIMCCLSVSVGQTADQSSNLDSDPASANPANLQSAAERTMEWLNEQITPPSEELNAQSGFQLFQDPKTKQSAIKTGATLTLVVSLFLLAIFMWRLKPGHRKSGKKNDEVLAVLGKVPFVYGQHLQLVRLGTRLLLVASSPKGSQTLAEISDPAEVLQIEAAFRQGRMDLLTESLQSRSAQTSASRNGISLGSDQRGSRTLLEA